MNVLFPILLALRSQWFSVSTLQEASPVAPVPMVTLAPDSSAQMLMSVW